MTLNLKYVAFVPYVSLFSVMSNCCFCHFWQLSWNYSETAGHSVDTQAL